MAASPAARTPLRNLSNSSGSILDSSPSSLKTPQQSKTPQQTARGDGDAHKGHAGTEKFNHFKEGWTPLAHRCKRTPYMYRKLRNLQQEEASSKPLKEFMDECTKHVPKLTKEKQLMAFEEALEAKAEDLWQDVLFQLGYTDRRVRAQSGASVAWDQGAPNSALQTGSLESVDASNGALEPDAANDADTAELVLDELVLSASAEPGGSLSDDDSVELLLCELMGELLGIASEHSLASMAGAVAECEVFAIEEPAADRSQAFPLEETDNASSDALKEIIQENGLDSLVQRKTFIEHMKEAAAVSAASQPRKTSRGASRSQIAHASSFQGSAALGDDSARFKSRLELMREEAEAARSARSDNPTPKTKPQPAEGPPLEDVLLKRTKSKFQQELSTARLAHPTRKTKPRPTATEAPSLDKVLVKRKPKLQQELDAARTSIPSRATKPSRAVGQHSASAGSGTSSGTFAGGLSDVLTKRKPSRLEREKAQAQAVTEPKSMDPQRLTELENAPPTKGAEKEPLCEGYEESPEVEPKLEELVLKPVLKVDEINAVRSTWAARWEQHGKDAKLEPRPKRSTSDSTSRASQAHADQWSSLGSLGDGVVKRKSKLEREKEAIAAAAKTSADAAKTI